MVQPPYYNSLSSYKYCLHYFIFSELTNVLFEDIKDKVGNGNAVPVALDSSDISGKITSSLDSRDSKTNNS